MLTNEERARRNSRYFWDTRRKTSDPETEGYGYDFDRMFHDLEAAEARAGWAEKAMDLASRLVTNILSGHPTTDPNDLFVVEFQKACDGYRAAVSKRD